MKKIAAKEVGECSPKQAQVSFNGNWQVIRAGRNLVTRNLMGTSTKLQWSQEGHFCKKELGYT